MQIKTFPHEFLARWGRDGKLQGHHVVPVDVLCDDAGIPITKENGENKMETFGVATTLERAGLSLDEILGSLHQGALKSLEAEREARTVEALSASEAIHVLEMERNGLKMALDHAHEQVADLQRQLSELQPKESEPRAVFTEL